MTFGFGFYSVLYGVGFCSVRVLALFLLSGSVRFLAKPRVLFLVRFALAGFGFSPVLCIYRLLRTAVHRALLDYLTLKCTDCQKCPASG